MNLIKRVKRGWSREYFRKNFLLILIIAFIPGIISGVGIQWFGVTTVKKELRERHTIQIAETAEMVDDQLEYLELSLSYWAFEKRFGPDLMDRNFVKDILETRDMMQLLTVIQGSHPLIERVELYINKDDEPLLFSPFYSKVKPVEYAYYQSLLKSDHSMGWAHTQQPRSDREESTILSHSIPGASQMPLGLLSVTLDQKKFGQLIQTLKTDEQGITFLMNSRQQMIVPETDSSNTYFVSALKNELTQLEDSSGSIEYVYNGHSYSVSFGQFDRVNDEWTYVSAVPLSAITAPIEWISRSIVIISITGLVVALILTWFGSQTIYRPVERLIEKVQKENAGDESINPQGEFTLLEEGFTQLYQERQRLKSRLTSETPQLQKSFLIQLSQGYLYQQTKQQLTDRMENYGWKIDQHVFRVIDIQAIGLEEGNHSFITSDEGLITFSIQNIVEELCEKYFDQFSVLDNYDLSVSLFLIEQPSQTKEMRSFVQELTSLVNRLLKLQLIISVSEPSSQVKRIHALFEETRQGKYQRRFKNQNQIHFLEETQMEHKRNQASYPFEVEREVVQSIRKGDREEIHHQLERFLNQLVADAKTWENIQMGMLQLFSRIQHEILHSDIHLEEIFSNRNLYAELSVIKEPVRMLNWLETNVIEPYLAHLKERVNQEVKGLVENVIDYLKSSYMHDISLDYCAEKFETNAHTLSRSFKKVTGIKFIDYLTDLRIEHSKRLLIETNLKIHEVAEQVGYRHSYFNRIFKKSVDLSPSEFRKKFGQ
ncbi:AraC family transcriptional regulator [Alkalihalobacillus sp. FSL W8-0930]